MTERVFVAGTDTEVGKTWVTAEVAKGLAGAGLRVAARKPVQSFAPGGDPTDAEVLGAATGEDPGTVCPPHRWYAVPLAPPMAAEALGKPPLSLADLVAETRVPSAGLCLIEGVGGPRSPVADDADNVELARSLDASRVILVAPPGLGTINSVLLSTEAFGDLPVTTILNRYDDADDLHRRNAGWLRDVAGVDLVTSCDDLIHMLTEKAEVR